MRVFLAETMSTKDVLRVQARTHFYVHLDGTTDQLRPTAGVKDVVIQCQRSKKGDRMFTMWEMSYVVPPEVQCEATWSLVETLLAAHPEIPHTFAGAFPHGFVWGSVPTVVGVGAREHIAIHTGGLFQEHYCLCRAIGCAPMQAMVLTREAAKRGGRTPIPEVLNDDLPGHHARRVQPG